MKSMRGCTPRRRGLTQLPEWIDSSFRALLLAGLLLPSMSSWAFDKTRLPLSPMLPTAEDCRQLRQELYRATSAAQTRISACMKQEPRFSSLPLRRGRCEMTGLVAWSQCVDLDEDACRLSDHAEEESNKCDVRAQQVAMANDRQRLQTALALAQLNAHQAQVKSAYAALGAARLAIMDPARLLGEALFKTDKPLLGLLFPGLVGQIGRNDTVLAEQLYKFAYQRAQAGTRLVPNRAIGEIQEASLGHIDRLYADIFRQMDSALAQMQSSQGQIDSLRFDAPRPSPTVRPAAAPDRECEILDDFASASKLRDDDVERFKSLTRRCTKG